jgi:hypothetical protein
MLARFDAPASSTLYIPFTSYNSSGASVTLTGLAVTDIEIYKDGSVTQRASDNGYTLLDTDGIDFDSITGLHGFSIDLSDNSDASFYAVGSQYWVVVSAVTIDSQAISFVAAWFRIVAAESVTGKPKVDVDAWLGTAAATPTTAGVPEVDVTFIAGSAVSTSSAQIGVNVVNAGGTAWASGSLTSGVFASGAITAASIAADAIGASELAADAVAEIADAVWDEDATAHQTQGTFGQAIGDPVADTNTIFKATVTDATGATVGVDVAAVLDDTGTSGVAIATGGITSATIATGAIDADALATDAVTEIWGVTVEGSYTALQMMRLYAAALGGKASGLATSTAVYRNTGDTTNRISATVDADGNRTAVTLDLT